MPRRSSSRNGIVHSEVGVKLNFIIRAVTCLTLVVVAASSFAQETDPRKLMGEIVEHQSRRIKEAREAGVPLDTVALNKELQAMALEAVEGVDPSTVDLRHTLSWTSLFSRAKEFQSVKVICLNFLKTEPDVWSKVAVERMLLSAYNSLGEVENLLELLYKALATQAPELSFEREGFLRGVIEQFADTIAGKQGLDAAVKVIDDVLATVKFEDPQEYAERMLSSYRSRNLKNDDGSAKTDEQLTAELIASRRAADDRLPYLAADKKWSLLRDAGRVDEGLIVLKQFIEGRDPESGYVHQATISISQTEIVGRAAPALTFDRLLGEFESLDEWKGKVVIIDFTAHW